MPRLTLLLSLLALVAISLLGCDQVGGANATPLPQNSAATTPTFTATRAPTGTPAPPTQTPTPTLTPSPTPTQLFQLFEEPQAALPQPAAYIEEATLFLLAWGVNKEPMAVDGCPPNTTECAFHWLRWAPSGDYLLYELSFINGEGDLKQALRMVNRDGAVEIVTTAPFFSAEWSPNSDQIVFVSDGAWQRDSLLGQEQMWQLTVVDIEEDGTLANWRREGFIGYFDGCDSAEISEQDKIRQIQSEDLVLAWSANDILLYTAGCNHTIGRFDMSTNQELTSYGQRVQKLKMHRDRIRWVGLLTQATGKTSIVLGSASTPTLKLLDTVATPIEVAFGPEESLLYSTVASVSEDDYADVYNQPVSTSLKIDIYASRIMTVDPTTKESAPLWESAEMIPTRLQSAGNQAWFVAIDNPVALQQAILEQKSAERLKNFLPRTQIMQLVLDGDSAETWRNDAHLFTFAPTR